MMVTLIDGPARTLGRISLPLKTTEAFKLYRDGVMIAGAYYRRIAGKPGDQTLSCMRPNRYV